jgi:2-amino-4-hydroxy-6-hydroxymethyldihydropteridine diphosphokinase
MNTFYLLVGSNINKRDNVIRCHELLQQKTTVVAHSSVYETPAIGLTGLLSQPSYYNLAYKVESSMSLIEFDRTICKSIETQLKRLRTQDKYAARTIDVDVVLCNNESYICDHIVVPAPDVLQCAHVLIPLVELEADYVHPVLKQTLADILRASTFDVTIKKVNILE